MNDRVIEEIANQLGMAVESTSQFLNDILPEYAAMKAIANGGCALLGLSIIVICVICFYFSHKAVKEVVDRKGCNYYLEDSRKTTRLVVGLVGGSIGGLLGLPMVIFNITNCLLWMYCPKAMFFNMVISSITGN